MDTSFSRNDLEVFVNILNCSLVTLLEIFFPDHLSYLQLSLGLRDKIEKSDVSRIVNVSSNAHRRYKLDIEDLQNSINYNGWKAYCRSKLLNVLTTYSFKKELNSKIESKSEKIYSMGYIEFQIEVIKRLWQKDESQWPMNEVWVVSGKDGAQIRVPAE